MINYRVENLGKLVEDLKKEGVTIVDKIESFDERFTISGQRIFTHPLRRIANRL